MLKVIILVWSFIVYLLIWWQVSIFPPPGSSKLIYKLDAEQYDDLWECFISELAIIDLKEEGRWVTICVITNCK